MSWRPPQGYVLDQPVAKNPFPPGYVLDQPTADPTQLTPEQQRRYGQELQATPLNPNTYEEQSTLRKVGGSLLQPYTGIAATIQSDLAKGAGAVGLESVQNALQKGQENSYLFGEQTQTSLPGAGAGLIQGGAMLSRWNPAGIVASGVNALGNKLSEDEIKGRMGEQTDDYAILKALGGGGIEAGMNLLLQKGITGTAAKAVISRLAPTIGKPVASVLARTAVGAGAFGARNEVGNLIEGRPFGTGLKEATSQGALMEAGGGLFHDLAAPKSAFTKAAPSSEATPAPEPSGIQAETSPQSSGAAPSKYAEFDQMTAEASKALGEDTARIEQNKRLLETPGQTVTPDKPSRGSGIKSALTKLATDESGGLKVPEPIKEIGTHLMDSARRLSGKMFPSMTRVGRKSGEAAARFVASRTYVKEAAPLIAEANLGTKGIDPKMDAKVGAALTQDSLDAIRQGFQTQAADALAKGDHDAFLKFEEQANGVKDIFGPDSPIKDRAEFDALSNDPEVMAAIKRHDTWFKKEPTENYKTAQGIDPATTLAPRGPKFGTRINLLALSDENPVRGASAGNLRNALEKRSAFAKRAKGSGEYELRYSKLVENTMGRDTELANQHRMNDQMVEEGLAVKGKPGMDRPLIAGKETVPFHIKDKTIVIPGTATVNASEILHVRSDVAAEYKDALNTKDREYSKTLNTVTHLANTTALQSLSEASYHVANQVSALINTPGTGTVIPAMFKRGFDLITKDPQTRVQLMKLAKIGALKEVPEPRSKFNPLTWTGKAIHFTDRVGRLVLDDAFTKLAKQGLVEPTETNRRNLVNQFGQYNKRAQHRLVALARDTGVGPFATAGTNFYGMGIKAHTLDAGVPGKNLSSSLALRGMVLARYSSILGAVALANYLKWGRVDGGNRIPIGAIRLADDEKTGKTRYVDVLSMTALGRGMRELGTKAIVEGIHQGDEPGAIVDRAWKDAALSPLAPFMGPAVNVASIAISGKNPQGYQVAEQAAQGESQGLQNLKAAGIAANPLVSASLSDTGDISEQLGKFRIKHGPKEESVAMTQAKRLQDHPEIARTRAEQDRYDARKELREALRKPGAKAYTLVASARKAGLIPEDQIQDAIKESATPENLVGVIKSGGYDPSQLMVIWDRTTGEEKSKVAQIIRNKIATSDTLKPAEKQKYLKQINDDLKARK